MSSKADEGANIRVICRMRPLNQQEIDMGGNVSVFSKGNTISVKIDGQDGQHDFTFDKVFTHDVTQRQVFNVVAKPVIQSVMSGFNGTIFCYGQTSSGQTHTMEGVLFDPQLKGLIPRMTEYVFSLIVNASEDIEFNLKVSMLEIYNQKIQDLLDVQKNNLQIQEDKLRGIFVQDCTEIYVTSPEEMIQVMQTGSQNRTIAATNMNEQSSRSHSLFLLTVLQKTLSTDTSKISKLYFVDLAGSEKISKTGVSGQQLEEAKNINQSLTCLGMVINALTSDKKEHIPYRDSRLTRILQESLGGTLRFGYRAQSIKNKPKCNEEKSAKELMKLLEDAERQIKVQNETIIELQSQLGLTPAEIAKIQNSQEKIHCADKQQEEQEEEQSQVTAEKKEEANPPKVVINPVTEPKIPITETQPQVQQDPVDEEKLELIRQAEKEKAAIAQANSNSASLKLVQQHMEINTLKDQIQRLENEKDELEIQLQEALDRLKIQQELNSVREYLETELRTIREKYSSVQDESLQIKMVMNLVWKQFNRIKSDLRFFLMTQSLKEIENQNISNQSNDKNQQKSQQNVIDEREAFEKLKDSIENCIQVIQEIESDFERFVQFDEKEGNNSPTQTDSNSSNFVSYNVDQFTNRSTAISITGKANKGDINEILSTDPDEEILNTFESNETERRSFVLKENKEVDDSKLDDDLDMDVTYAMVLKNDLPQDVKNLILSQKKIIKQILLQNKQVEASSHMTDQKLIKTKQKFQDKQNLFIQKIKDLEIKLSNMGNILIEKAEEEMKMKSQYERTIQIKNKNYTEQKIQVEQLKKILATKDPLKRICELEANIKHLGTERQVQFNELYTIRQEIEMRETNMKNIQIQNQKLTRQLDSLNKEIEKMKQERFNHDYEQNNIASPRAIVIENQFKGSGMGYSGKFFGSSNNPSFPNGQENRDLGLIGLKSILQPSIRGGGGNQKNYEKNNGQIFSGNSGLLSFGGNDKNYYDNSESYVNSVSHSRTGSGGNNMSINMYLNQPNSLNMDEINKKLNKIKQPDPNDKAGDVGNTENYTNIDSPYNKSQFKYGGQFEDFQRYQSSSGNNFPNGSPTSPVGDQDNDKNRQTSQFNSNNPEDTLNDISLIEPNKKEIEKKFDYIGRHQNKMSQQTVQQKDDGNFFTSFQKFFS